MAPRLEVFRSARQSNGLLTASHSVRENGDDGSEYVAASLNVSEGGASAPLFVCSKQTAAT